MPGPTRFGGSGGRSFRAISFHVFPPSPLHIVTVPDFVLYCFVLVPCVAIGRFLLLVTERRNDVPWITGRDHTGGATVTGNPPPPTFIKTWTISSSGHGIVYTMFRRRAFMKKTDLAYLAGLLDGEGTVTLAACNPGVKSRYPCLSCSSTSPELLQLLKTTFGGTIVIHKRYKSHHKQSWSWKIEYTKAVNALRQLLPYMKESEKVRRAKLIVSTYEKVTARNGKYSPTLQAKRQKFVTEFFSP